MADFMNVNVVYFYVKDWEASKKFYRDLLGWPVAWTSDEVGWEEYGEEGSTHLAINRWDEPGSPPHANNPTCTLTVEDCHKTTEWLRAKGIKCDDVVVIPNVVTYVGFYDPEGNRIQFAGLTPQ